MTMMTVDDFTGAPPVTIRIRHMPRITANSPQYGISRTLPSSSLAFDVVRLVYVRSV
jgi:hypothetical protein